MTARLRRILPAAAALAAGIAFTGCAGGGWAGGGAAGELRAVSLSDEPVELAVRYESAVYSNEPGAAASFLLADVTAEELLNGEARDGRVMHIELLWIPKAGATPLDSAATNATIRFVLFTQGEVGIYGGAGFATPEGSLGSDAVRISLRDATVRLIEATDGFYDKLSPAHVTGTFRAVNDPKNAVRMQRAISQFVTEKFDRRMFVRASAHREP